MKGQNMLPALALAMVLHGHCNYEYRDEPNHVKPGQVVKFEVATTTHTKACELDTLFIVADNNDQGITLMGGNNHDGYDLTVSIRIPKRGVKRVTLYPEAYTTENPYSPPIADLPPIRVS